MVDIAKRQVIEVLDQVASKLCPLDYQEFLAELLDHVAARLEAAEEEYEPESL